MTQGDAPVPHLRRDPNPQQTGGRKVLVGVAVFFLVLVGFVLTLVFTIGEHNHGVVLPPGASASPGDHVTRASAPSPQFFAIDAATGANAFVGSDATYSSYSKHQRAVAVGAAPDGRTAYFAIPLPGCRTRIDQTHRGNAIRNKPLGVVDGHVLGFPMTVSPDGKQLAWVMKPSGAGGRCGSSQVVNIADIADLHGHVIQRLKPGLTISLTWDQDSGQLVVHQATANDPQVALWWHGHLAVISNGAIRTLGPNGPGAMLATGLPDNVHSVSVDPTGTKLLVSGGVETVRDPGHISYYSTYVWSNGMSFHVPGEWIDPAW